MDSFASASDGDIPIPPLSSELNAPVSYATGFWSSASESQQPSPGACEAEDSPVNGEEQHRPAAKKASPSLSASSSSSSSKPSKRKQFSSCDACRMRKVRCIKDPSREACNSCIAKSIHCTRQFAGTSLTKAKRVQQARQTFGTAGCAAAANTPTTMALFQPLAPSSNGFISQTDMFNRTLSANALQSLLHAYGADVQDSTPVVDLARLMQTCQAVQFDLERLDTLDQILCLSAAATAAQVQDSQRRLDYRASAMLLANPIESGRALACKVFEAADREGLLRKPSIRSVQILRLLCILTSAEEANHLRRSDAHRAYERALVEHMRALSDRGELGEPQSSALFWSIITGDSFASAVSGQPPALSDDDLEAYASFVDYSTQGILTLINGLHWPNVDGGGGLLIANLCKLAREYCKRITSARARRKGLIDIQMIQDIIPEVERLDALTDIFKQKLLSLYGSESDIPGHLIFWIKVMRSLFMHITIIAMDDTEKAIARELADNPVSNRVPLLQQAFDAMQSRCLVELFRAEQHESPGQMLKIMASTDGLISYLVVMRLRRILKLPTIEEGYLAADGRSIAEKEDTARRTYEACVWLAEVVPCMKADLPALLAEVDDLRDRANAFAAAGTLACPPAVPGQYHRNLRSQDDTCSSMTSNPVPSNAVPAWHAGLISATSRFTDLPEPGTCSWEKLLQANTEAPSENLVLPPVWSAGTSSSSASQPGATAMTSKADANQCDSIDPLSVYLNWPA